MPTPSPHPPVPPSKIISAWRPCKHHSHLGDHRHYKSNNNSIYGPPYDRFLKLENLYLTFWFSQFLYNLHLWDEVLINQNCEIKSQLPFLFFLSPCRNKHLVSIYPILTFFSQLWVYILLFSELQNCDCEIKSHSYFLFLFFLLKKKHSKYCTNRNEREQKALLTAATQD